VDPEGPIEAWVDAVRKLWHDASSYAACSAAALAYSKRPEINPDVQIDKLIDVAEKAIGYWRPLLKATAGKTAAPAFDGRA
jgi:hypothetical protein